MLSSLSLSADPKAVSCGDKTKQNIVLEQAVTPGTEVAQGSTVTYNWCAGPASVTIPNLLIGQPVATAKTQLEALHLTVKVVQVDSDQPKDRVVAVSPDQGSTVAEGQEVTLSISKENRKKLPDVANKTYTADGAKAVLRNLGFQNVSTVQREVTDPSPDGIVVDMDPPAGSARDPETTQVTLFVGHFTQPSPSGSPTASPPAS